VVCLALLGLLLVVLAGPILAILGTVLAFAFVGFLVWGLYRAIAVGKSYAWLSVSEASLRGGRATAEAGKWLGETMLWASYWICVELWLAARYLGKNIAWKSLPGKGKEIGQNVAGVVRRTSEEVADRGLGLAQAGWKAACVTAQTGQHLGQALQPVLAEAWGQTGSLVQAGWRKAHELGSFGVGLLLETACGALVGALLGAAFHFQHNQEAALPVGAAVGALLGAFVGISRREPAKESA
jgi:hypothetical protein